MVAMVAMVALAVFALADMDATVAIALAGLVDKERFDVVDGGLAADLEGVMQMPTASQPYIMNQTGATSEFAM